MMWPFNIRRKALNEGFEDCLAYLNAGARLDDQVKLLEKALATKEQSSEKIEALLASSLIIVNKAHLVADYIEKEYIIPVRTFYIDFEKFNNPHKELCYRVASSKSWGQE